MPGRIIFVSDVHLSPFTQTVDKRFKKFLLKEKKTTVFILGDLFDFGFVFAKGIHPYYKEWIEWLLNFKNLTFLPGNHDFWMYNYLKHCGLKVIPNPSTLSINQKRFLLGHGKFGKNPKLSLSRLFLSFPPFVFLYSLLPPVKGTLLAHHIMNIKRKRKCKQKRLKIIIPQGYDFLIEGHNHIEFIKKIENTIIANPGSFKQRGSFILYRDNELHLCYF